MCDGHVFKPEEYSAVVRALSDADFAPGKWRENALNPVVLLLDSFFRRRDNSSGAAKPWPTSGLISRAIAPWADWLMDCFSSYRVRTAWEYQVRQVSHLHVLAWGARVKDLESPAQ